VTKEAVVAAPTVGDRRGDLGDSLRLTQAARDGAMEAWLEVLSQRHPGLVWVPLPTLSAERAEACPGKAPGGTPPRHDKNQSVNGQRSLPSQKEWATVAQVVFPKREEKDD
jgi:hypothetical protein